MKLLKTLALCGVFMMGMVSTSQAAILKLDAQVTGGIPSKSKDSDNKFDAMWQCHKNTSKYVATTCQIAVGKVGDSPLISLSEFKKIRASAGNATLLKMALLRIIPRYSSDLTDKDINTLVDLFTSDEAVTYIRLHREVADINFKSVEVSSQDFNQVEASIDAITSLLTGFETQVEESFGDESDSILEEVADFVAEVK